MVAVRHAHTSMTTEQAHGADGLWTDVPGALIADAEIVDGVDTILMITGQINSSSTSRDVQLRTTQGTIPTVLDGSTHFFESNSNLWHNYCYIARFTSSVVLGENVIQMQMRTDEPGLAAVRVDTVEMTTVVLNDLAPGDFFFGENSVSTPLTTSFVDFATTGAFTPANDGDTWWVIFTSLIHINSSSINYEARVRLDGSTAVPDDDAPEFSREGEDSSNDEIVAGLSRAFVLDNTEHQFWIQARDDSGPSNVHEHTAVFAFRLNACQNFRAFWNEADFPFAVADTYEEVGNIEPIIGPIASDVFVAGSLAFSAGSSAREGNLRIEVDGVQHPAGYDDHTNVVTYDPTDEYPGITSFVLEAQLGALDIDLDGKGELVSAGEKVEDRSLVAFTFELASVEPEPAGGLPEYGQIRTAIGDPPVFGATILRS